ncbi:MAG: helix-turn-helix domain-containing protein [Candidatus Bathyarchaeia archaeon]
MSNVKYSVEVKPENRLVEVRFASNVNLNSIEYVLNQLRSYIAEGYRVELIGYVNRESNYIKAFTLALSLFGNDGRVVFKNKSRFSKAERRKYRKLVQELKDKGYDVRRISEEFNIPLKTVYRWLKS